MLLLFRLLEYVFDTLFKDEKRVELRQHRAREDGEDLHSRETIGIGDVGMLARGPRGENSRR